MKVIIFLLMLAVFTLQANRGLQLKMMNSEQRVALVIGNNRYNSDRLANLRNPINDAKAMKNKLKSLGFKVFYGENLRVRDMNKKLRLFTSKLTQGGVGLFFFAGHGIESDGKNYLIGKDSNVEDKEDVAYESLALNKVIDKMNRAGNRLNILLLDACRSDPFSRSGGGGLAKVDDARGMFIAYATSPGDVASDGKGNHGAFTQEILNNIDAEGVPLGRLFKRIKRGVYNKTNQRQRPWTYDDIIGDFFFVLPTNNKVVIESYVPALNKKSSIKSYTLKKIYKKSTKDVVVLGDLMWQDNLDVKVVKRDWQGAKDYCQNLSLAGYSDWRSPNKDELRGIVDKSRKPTIKKEFKNFSSSSYWSSTTLSSYQDGAWIVYFRSGAVSFNYKSSNLYVRCVRAGQ